MTGHYYNLVKFYPGVNFLAPFSAATAQGLAEYEKCKVESEVVIDAIRQLMTPPETRKRKLGFSENRMQMVICR